MVVDLEEMVVDLEERVVDLEDVVGDLEDVESELTREAVLVVWERVAVVAAVVPEVKDPAVVVDPAAVDVVPLAVPVTVVDGFTVVFVAPVVMAFVVAAVVGAVVGAAVAVAAVVGAAVPFTIGIVGSASISFCGIVVPVRSDNIVFTSAILASHFFTKVMIETWFMVIEAFSADVHVIVVIFVFVIVSAIFFIVSLLPRVSISTVLLYNVNCVTAIVKDVQSPRSRFCLPSFVVVANALSICLLTLLSLSFDLYRAKRTCFRLLALVLQVAM